MTPPDAREAALTELIAKIVKETSGAPSIVLADGQNYKVIPTVLADELEALVAAVQGQAPSLDLLDELETELTRIGKINTDEDRPRTVPELTVYIWLQKARAEAERLKGAAPGQATPFKATFGNEERVFTANFEGGQAPPSPPPVVKGDIEKALELLRDYDRDRTKRGYRAHAKIDEARGFLALALVHLADEPRNTDRGVQGPAASPSTGEPK